MVNILHGFMTKEMTIVLPLHISRKIVLYQPPRVWGLIFTHHPLLPISLYSDFFQRYRTLSTKLLHQEFLNNLLILSFKNLFILAFTNV
jgi:hypothetical protein